MEQISQLLKEGGLVIDSMDREVCTGSGFHDWRLGPGESSQHLLFEVGCLSEDRKESDLLPDRNGTERDFNRYGRYAHPRTSARTPKT